VRLIHADSQGAHCVSSIKEYAVKSFYVIIALTAVFICSFDPALSASFYVSPSGAGEECTQDSPCSLATGLSRPQPGDEVVLLDGTYSEPLIVQRGGAPDLPVTVRAASKWAAVVRVPDGILGRVWASHVTLSGVTFDGAKTGGKQGGVRVGAGSEASLPEPVHDVILDSLQIHDVRASAISITSGEHDVVIRHCLIERTGQQEFWGEAFYLGSKYYPAETVYNVDIYLNTVRGFTQNGLETKKHSHHVKVHDNYFYDQMLWSSYGGDPNAGNEGTITLDGHSNEAYSNKLWSNECGIAVFVVEPEAGHKIYNNLIFAGTGRGDHAVRMKEWSKTWPSGQYPPSEVFNNTFFQLPSHAVGTLDPSILIVKNNIGLDLEGNLPSSETVSELFRDPLAGDFRLAEGSPAIDRAEATPYSVTDFRAQEITGTCRDFGAFEFSADNIYFQKKMPGQKRAPAAPGGLRTIEVGAGD